jgi:outer membrane biosynthesis protein TonB
LLAASLTACNGGSAKTPALRRADARPLMTLAARIQHEGACAQRKDIARLQQQTRALVNTRRVPSDLQEPLMSGVNALAADSPPCIPVVPVQTTTASPPPTPTPPPPHKHPKPKPKPPHHHGHGHDKHGKDH